MEKKISKSGIEYKPFDVENALSLEGIDMLQINLTQLNAHNDQLQDQNRDLQKDRIILTKALELSITDFFVEATGKEPTAQQIKSEVEDYMQQAEIALNEGANELLQT